MYEIPHYHLHCTRRFFRPSITDFTLIHVLMTLLSPALRSFACADSHSLFHRTHLMIIAVNTRVLIPNRLEGIGTYTHNVLRQMVVDYPEHEFVFIFDRPFSSEFMYGPNVRAVVAGPPARHPFLYVVWFEYAVARLLRRIQPDVFLSPDGYLSLRSSVPQVPVIHDLNFEHFPQFFSTISRWHYQTYFPRYARKAARISTVSEFSKDDIVRTYGISPEKIDVAYNGVDPIFTPAQKVQIDDVKRTVTSGEDYFIFVGGLYRRKNLGTVLRAFDAFKQRTGSRIKFVVAGQSYPETDEVYALVRKLSCADDVIFLGRVEPRDRIPVLLSGALALVYASVFEGFGLPVAEAMACGTPVITGQITAMKEVAGDAAVLIDPNDHHDIAQAMETIVASAELRRDLRKAGLERAPQFSWKNTATMLWSTISRAAAGNH